MFNVYLVQRCRISQEPSPGKRFGECVVFDYMGSSEFEFGAIPKCFEALEIIHSKMTIWKHHRKSPFDNKDIFVLSLPEQRLPFAFELEMMFNGKSYTKEYVFSEFDKSNDLWIDLKNNIIFSKQESFLKEIGALIKNSNSRIKENRKIEEQSQKLFRELNLSRLDDSVRGISCIVGHSVDHSDGTRALKSLTQYPIVYWINGPLNGKKYLGEFYTIEQILEYVNFKSGVIARKILESNKVT